MKNGHSVSTRGFSVVIPLFNNEREITRAVNSVLAQTCQPDEILVVDDGSADRSARIVEGMTDRRIRLIRQPNQGVSSARNTGIHNAACDTIAFLDADDEWKPDFLQTISTLMESHPSCSVYGTSYVYCDHNEVIRTPVLRGVPSGDWSGVLTGYFRVASISDPPLWSSAVSIRKEALQSIGGFPVGIKAGEDLLTWARLALNYKIAYSTRACSIFHLSSSIGGVPTRIPEIPDRVGEALQRLVDTVDDPTRKDFKHYVAFWHRMRAAMFLQIGSRSDAFRDLRWIARYNCSSPQLYLYSGLLILPSGVRKKALALLSSLKTQRRKASSHG